MAALDFPSAPTVGQQYTANGNTWQWDGATWAAQDSISSYYTTNTQTTSYTLALTDHHTLVYYNSASAGTITVPPNSSVAFPIGTEIFIGQLGTGALTLAAGAGVTLTSPQGLFFNKQYLTARIVKTATNSWTLGFYGLGAKTDLPVYGQVTATGAVTIDRNNGECQRLSVTGNVTSLTISNFGSAGTFAKIALEIWNTGAFTFAWPAGTIWPGGTAPTLTSGAGKKDVVMLMTMDGGTTIYGTLIGANYS